MSQDQWISTDDRLPERQTKVLVYVKNNKISQRLHFDVYSYDPNLYQPHWSYVTHWMPLPKPPTNMQGVNLID